MRKGDQKVITLEYMNKVYEEQGFILKLSNGKVTGFVKEKCPTADQSK